VLAIRSQKYFQQGVIEARFMSLVDEKSPRLEKRNRGLNDGGWKAEGGGENRKSKVDIRKLKKRGGEENR